jgi:hypothetical protein
VWFRRRAIPFVMPASPGGSVVAQSLLRQAADRGVTICFADLDGADGLWVPEERTVLVNRGLSEAQVAEVIEHELAHVLIDDQHADLDAGKEVLVGQPPSPGRRREAVALAAALGLVAVVGGVMYGIHTARGPVKQDQVAPNPNGTGLTFQESGSPSLSPSRAPGGAIVYVTVYPTPPMPSVPGSPIDLPSLSPTATRPVPSPTAARTTAGAPPKQQTTSSAPPPPAQTSEQPPPQTTPTPDPTSVVPSPDESAGAGGAGGDTGDQGGVGGTDSGPVGTDPATAADASAAVPDGGTTNP